MKQMSWLLDLGGWSGLSENLCTACICTTDSLQLQLIGVLTKYIWRSNLARLSDSWIGQYLIWQVEGSSKVYKMEGFVGRRVGQKVISKRKCFRQGHLPLRRRAGGLIRWIISSSFEGQRGPWLVQRPRLPYWCWSENSRLIGVSFHSLRGWNYN